MAPNTLTNLIPTLYEAADVVANEPVGLISAVTLNASAEQAAIDQTVRYPITGASTLANVASGATGPDPAAETYASDTMSITSQKSDTFFFEGNEQVGLGGLYQPLLKQRFAQAFRAINNAISAEIAAYYYLASCAYGTAGTAPFNTAGDFSDLSQIIARLIENGAPPSDIQCVLNPFAAANLKGKQSQAQMQGGTDPLRRGVLLDHMGAQVREDAQIKTHTAGSAANATTDDSGYAIGDTTITLASAGTGAILQGDVLAHARDTRKYVVKTGDADVSGGGTFVLNNPGVKLAITAATSALTLAATHACNLVFSRSAIHLLTRVPPMPEGGDSADDVTTISLPGLNVAYQVAMYRQRRRVAYEVAAAWGSKVVKTDFLGVLMG